MGGQMSKERPLPREMFAELGRRLVSYSLSIPQGENDEATALELIVAGLMYTRTDELDDPDFTQPLGEDAYRQLERIGFAPQARVLQVHNWTCFESLQVEGISVDLALVNPGDDHGRIAVQITEASEPPDQCKHGRYLRRRGWYLIRFADQQVAADPVGCAREIRKLMAGLEHDDLERRSGTAVEDTDGQN